MSDTEDMRYAQDICDMGKLALDRCDGDGCAALDLLCDALAFLVSEQGLTVSGIEQRIQESRSVFDDAKTFVQTGQRHTI